MAYAFTFTVREVVTETAADGLPRAMFQVEISETEAAATSEAEIPLSGTDSGGVAYKLPASGRVFTQLSELESGAGTTVDPVLGDQTDPAAGAWRVENDTAAALIHNESTSGVRYAFDTGDSFFHRSVVDAGTDNTITSRYFIGAGWGI